MAVSGLRAGLWSCLQSERIPVAHRHRLHLSGWMGWQSPILDECPGPSGGHHKMLVEFKRIL